MRPNQRLNTSGTIGIGQLDNIQTPLDLSDFNVSLNNSMIKLRNIKETHHTQALLHNNPLEKFQNSSIILSQQSRNLQAKEDKIGQCVSFTKTTATDYKTKFSTNSNTYQSQVKKTEEGQSLSPEKKKRQVKSVIKSKPSTSFKTTRMIRYSSNPWEEDPSYVSELIRYNELHHHDYNPTLDSKASRKIFTKILQIPVSRNKNDFDRRFHIKPPESQVFIEINKKDQPHHCTAQTKRSVSQIQKMSGTNPYRLFDRFIQDYQNESSTKELYDAAKKNEQKVKMKEIFKIYEKKLFPKSKYQANDLSNIPLTKALKMEDFEDKEKEKEDNDPYNFDQDNRSSIVTSNNGSRKPSVLRDFIQKRQLEKSSFFSEEAKSQLSLQKKKTMIDGFKMKSSLFMINDTKSTQRNQSRRTVQTTQRSRFSLSPQRINDKTDFSQVKEEDHEAQGQAHYNQPQQINFSFDLRKSQQIFNVQQKQVDDQKESRRLFLQKLLQNKRSYSTNRGSPKNNLDQQEDIYNIAFTTNKIQSSRTKISQQQSQRAHSQIQLKNKFINSPSEKSSRHNISRQQIQNQVQTQYQPSTFMKSQRCFNKSQMSERQSQMMKHRRNRLSFDLEGNKQSIMAVKNFDHTKNQVSSILDQCSNQQNPKESKHRLSQIKKQEKSFQCSIRMKKLEKENFKIVKAFQYFQQHQEDTVVTEGQAVQSQDQFNLFDRIKEVLEDLQIEKECDLQNFMSKEVIKQFQDENVKMANFLKQLAGIQKNQIWKPDKYIIRADLDRDCA